jgi:hypothetical protein
MELMIDFLLLLVLAAALIAVFIVLTGRKPSKSAYKYAVGLSLSGAFLLFWVNGAVGIIGDASNDANMMYYVVLSIGAIGGVIARFQPRGMALVMFTVALAQVLAAVTALIARSGSEGPAWPWDVLILTGFFTVLWTGSAMLFRLAVSGNSS